MQRNSVRGPAFATVDAALVQNTYIHEGINLQLRAEMFNLFNRTNIANPRAPYLPPRLGEAQRLGTTGAHRV
jgi:hypothetical protein